jgi:hypothetical protein
MPICASTYARIYIVTCLLKARTGEPVEVDVREWPCKCHVTAGCHGEEGNATVEELWEEVFSLWSVSWLYNEEQLPFRVSLRKKALGPDWVPVG